MQVCAGTDIEKPRHLAPKIEVEANGMEVKREMNNGCIRKIKRKVRQM